MVQGTQDIFDINTTTYTKGPLALLGQGLLPKHYVHRCHPRWIKAVTIVNSVSNVDAATMPDCRAALDLDEEVGHVTLGYAERSRGSQAKAVASAHILDAAEALTVVAHGLVVGLGPRKPHTSSVSPAEVTLNAKASMVPHMSEDVAASRLGICPDWLTLKTMALFNEMTLFGL